MSSCGLISSELSLKSKMNYFGLVWCNWKRTKGSCSDFFWSGRFRFSWSTRKWQRQRESMWRKSRSSGVTKWARTMESPDLKSRIWNQSTDLNCRSKGQRNLARLLQTVPEKELVLSWLSLIQWFQVTKAALDQFQEGHPFWTKRHSKSTKEFFQRQKSWESTTTSSKSKSSALKALRNSKALTSLMISRGSTSLPLGKWRLWSSKNTPKYPMSLGHFPLKRSSRLFWQTWRKWPFAWWLNPGNLLARMVFPFQNISNGTLGSVLPIPFT